MCEILKINFFGVKLCEFLIGIFNFEIYDLVIKFYLYEKIYYLIILYDVYWYDINNVND